MTDSVIFIFGMIVSSVFTVGVYTYLRIRFEHLAENKLNFTKTQPVQSLSPLSPLKPQEIKSHQELHL